MRRPESVPIATFLLAMLVPVASTYGAEGHEHRSTSPGERHVTTAEPATAHEVPVDSTGSSGSNGRSPVPTPTLAGQYAFATIAEIVALLERDPATDWTRVDLERLRRHLVDMHRVTLEANVVDVEVPGGARFTVTGEDERVRDSIRRMTRDHAATRRGAGKEDDGEGGGDGWHYALDTRPDGVAFTVTGEDETAAARIRAYGFIGVMAAGTHHSRHHLALARGESPHAH